jgi:hypothetical protein
MSCTATSPHAGIRAAAVSSIIMERKILFMVQVTVQ